MPELPEVETVKETLKKLVLNKKINNVVILYPNIINNKNLDEFKEQIKNETINNINRRGKWLIFELNNFYLLSHLRMEGKYIIKKLEEKFNKHDHIIFTLDEKENLCYNDTRKFGKMHLVKKDELDKTPLSKLGLEPWDENLTPKYLK